MERYEIPANRAKKSRFRALNRKFSKSHLANFLSQLDHVMLDSGGVFVTWKRTSCVGVTSFYSSKTVTYLAFKQLPDYRVRVGKLHWPESIELKGSDGEWFSLRPGLLVKLYLWSILCELFQLDAAKEGLKEERELFIRRVLPKGSVEMIRAKINDLDAAVLLFGSRARGVYSPISDVDLLVIGPDANQAVSRIRESWGNDDALHTLIGRVHFGCSDPEHKSIILCLRGDSVPLAVNLKDENILGKYTRAV